MKVYKLPKISCTISKPLSTCTCITLHVYVNYLQLYGARSYYSLVPYINENPCMGDAESHPFRVQADNSKKGQP